MLLITEQLEMIFGGLQVNIQEPAKPEVQDRERLIAKRVPLAAQVPTFAGCNYVQALGT
jgi:hypothetical protein